MNDILYPLMLGALIVRPNIPALIYVFMLILLDQASGDTDGSAYFALAALADLLTVVLLSCFKVSRKIICLMLLCVGSIIINMVGYTMWYLYQPPTLYMWLFGMLYTAAILIILRKDGTDVGGRTTLYFNRTGHHFNADSGRRNLTESD